MTSKTTMLSLLAITVLVTVGVSEAQASNWNDHSWPIDDVVYKCISVSSITSTSNVSPCSDLTTSSNIWEVSNSNLTLNETTGTYNIAVYSWSSGVSGAGKTVTGGSGSEITWAYIAMNRSLDWEDTPNDTSTDGYDWRTATGHEFGHTIGLAHYTANAYVMFSPLSENDEDRNPTSHTTNHIKDNY